MSIREKLMLAALIGPIANLASSWMSSKVEKVKADGQAQVAQAKAKAVVAEKVATGEVAWEKSMADSTDNSWKDEFALIVLFIPITCYTSQYLLFIAQQY
jgi:hypothetical protein